MSSVFVRYNLGPGVAVELQEEASVAELKEVVGSQQGVRPDNLRVLFAGRELQSTATLQVRGQARPGIMGGPQMARISQTERNRHRSYTHGIKTEKLLNLMFEDQCAVTGHNKVFYSVAPTFPGALVCMCLLCSPKPHPGGAV